VETETHDGLDDWYSGRYASICATGRTDSRMHRAMHRFLEKDQGEHRCDRVLEIGANNAEHLRFVRHAWHEYVLTDIRVPADEVLKALPPGAHFEIADAMSLPFPDAHFDRAVSTCVFHHLSDPEAGFRELRRVTKVGGSISILLPNDPGLLYRVVRDLTSMRSARRLDLLPQARLFHAREHRNHFASLLVLARHVYRLDQVTVRNYPFPWLAWNLNALSSLTIKKR
jgi:SAM-dependent methyltransferase